MGRPKALRILCGCGRYDYSDLLHCGGVPDPDLPIPNGPGCHRSFSDSQAFLAHLGEDGCRNPASEPGFYAVAGTAGHRDATVWQHGPRPDRWPLRVHPTPPELVHR